MECLDLRPAWRGSGVEITAGLTLTLTLTAGLTLTLTLTAGQADYTRFNTTEEDQVTMPGIIKKWK